MKIKYSKPPTEKKLLSLLNEEISYTKGIALECITKYRTPNIQFGVVMKSAVPKTKNGRTLAHIRDELSRIRVFLQALKYQK